MAGAFNEDKYFTKKNNVSYKLVYLLVIFSMSLIAFRLWHLQITTGDELKTFSDRNSLKKTKILAPRGVIYDTENRTLVNNYPGYVVTISPQYTKKLDHLSETIAPILEMDAYQIKEKVVKGKRRNGPFLPVIIKKNLSREEVFKLKRLRVQYTGLEIEKTLLRKYNLKTNGAQLFGFVRPISKSEIIKLSKKHPEHNFERGDLVGKKGIELSLEPVLKGYNGAEFIEVDARGRKTYKSSSKFLSIKPQPPTPGKSLVLTIDKDIQEAAYKAFQREDWLGDRVGSIVVLKNTGEILAWVSAPAFDPNNFTTGISVKEWSALTNNPDRPLRNRVIQDPFPPGSTFKPIIALAALQEKIISEYTKLHAPGSFKLGKGIYHDSHREGHGHINVKQAIEASSNVFFYKVGQTLGIDRIHNYSKLFGLGEKTNLNIGYESRGIMPSKKWKKKTFGEVWTPGETILSAIGQSYVETTALQIAKAYNVIAQDGKIYKPYLIKKVLDHNNNELETHQPELIDDLTQQNSSRKYHIKAKHFKAVKMGMKDVFHGDKGTAKWYQIRNFEMAGKTGTSQVKRFSAQNIYKKCKNRPRKFRHHGWFAGFAPYKNPEITIAVLAEHGCSGALGGAGVFKDIVLAYLEKYKPDVFLQTQGKKIGALNH